jgi:protein ImuB
MSCIAPPGEPLALVAAGRRGLTVTAVTAAAATGGVHTGMALADARALLPALRSQPAAPMADRRALLRLTRWCGRYGPGRNIDIRPADGGEDGGIVLDHGLWIDVTGVAHLYGGEEALLDDLAARLAGFGVTARLGLADTLGAAHALARFACEQPPGRRWASAPAGQTAACIAALPVDALRLEKATTVALRRLGLRRIGDLYEIPRTALERRFHQRTAAGAATAGALTRLDQALGRTSEPRRPLRDVPDLVLTQSFPAPLVSAEGIVAEARRLTGRLCGMLEARNLGARRIRLVLYRADGTMAAVTAGTSAPVRDPSRLMSLLADRLERIDAGLGIDALAIEAPAAEPLVAATAAFAERLAGRGAAADTGELIDRLSNRLGADGVTVLIPRASHIPERSEIRQSALSAAGRAAGGATGWAAGPMPGAARPAILLRVPEPIGVTAEVPDGAPAVFTWRRITRRIARAEGPERIAPEWWRALPAPAGGAPDHPDGGQPVGLMPPADAPRTRDYYRIEDASGAGYWVFRSGLYGETGGAGAPVWFLHGLFA